MERNGDGSIFQNLLVSKYFEEDKDVKVKEV